MASVSKDKKGNRKIQFLDNGQRRTVYLGKFNARQANAFKVRLEALLASRTAGPDEELIQWLESLPDDIHAKLARLSLVKPRASHTLSSYVDYYIESRKDVKPTTKNSWNQTKRVLIDFFGGDRDIRSITPAMATRWREAIAKDGLGDVTVRKRTSIAKQIFKRAMTEGAVRENPFSDLVSSAVANKSRDFFVNADLTAQVMDAMSNTQWRTIFALARFGGVRVPSELLPLKWCDINWDRGTILITSPKTAHLVGGESRVCPLFPELREILLEAHELAPEGSEYVISDRKTSSCNLRTQFLRMLNRSGIPVWAKPFQNLRSTRETELIERFPIHVVCKWLGNSPAVASKHYLQVNDDHFLKATQNPTQQVLAGPRDDSQEEMKKPCKHSDLHQIASCRETLQKAKCTPERIRTSDLWFRKPMLYPTELRAQVVIFKQYMLCSVIA